MQDAAKEEIARGIYHESTTKRRLSGCLENRFLYLLRHNRMMEASFWLRGSASRRALQSTEMPSMQKAREPKRLTFRHCKNTGRMAYTMRNKYRPARKDQYS